MRLAKLTSGLVVSKNVLNKEFKENNLSIIKKFSPVVSEYKFQVGHNRRITMTLTEDEFIQKEERLFQSKWLPTIETHQKNCNGEDALITAINKILDIGSKYKQFRIIK